MEAIHENWWGNFFDDVVGQLYVNRVGRIPIPSIVDFLIQALNLSPGDRLFDQCCGVGTLSHAFAECGINTIGIDQAEDYIVQARQNKLPCTFVVGDAFNFVPNPCCDAGINWATSFGYLDDDQKNIEMLNRMYESIKPGGYFAIEYSNAACDLNHFQKVKEYHHVLSDGELLVRREYHLDLERGMRGSHWLYHFPNGETKRSYGESRLYLPRDIIVMLESCRFKNIKTYADVQQNPVTVDSPRFICVAQK